MDTGLGGSEAPSLDKDTSMVGSGSEQLIGIGGVGLDPANPPLRSSGKENVEPEGSTRKPDQCIPKTGTCPELIIPSDIIAKKSQYYKDHALIGKFLGLWASEKALIAWIHTV